MKIFLILFFSLLSLKASADFIFAPGATVSTPFESTEKASTGDKILDASAGGGLVLNLDWIVFGPLTLGVGVGYQARSATVQYQNSIATANNLDVSMIQLMAEAGAKLRIINFKRFKTFIGGGFAVGNISLTFDEDEFEDMTGSSNGFEENESKSYGGIYLDGGIEYILSNTGGLRFSVKYYDLESKKFENLNDQSVTFSNMSYAIQYMHYVNWDFFWK